MILAFQTFSRRGLRGRRYYFRIIAANGEPVAQSEGYRNRLDRDSTIALIKRGAKDADVKERK